MCHGEHERKGTTMGNRAVITDRDKRVGVYLHWNGGRHSVEAFLKYCKLRGFRTGDYGWARLCQVIGNFFGGGLSVGIDTLDHLDCDNGDNGMYIMDGWELVGHEHDEPCNDDYDVDELVMAIDSCQPQSEQLGHYLKAVEVPVSELRVGDVVWMEQYDGERVPYEVVGFGDDENLCFGEYVGVPYTSAYGKDNTNSYVRGKTCKVCPEESRDAMVAASREYMRRHDEWMRKPLACRHPNFNEILHELGY